jgi:hypothetical protein
VTIVLGSDETPNPNAYLEDALLEFTGCVGKAIPDICSYSLTVGEAYVPFEPDEEDECEEDDEWCSQVWVRVQSIRPREATGEGFDNSGFGLVLVADLEVGVLRCFEVMEEGEAPSATQVMVAAMQSMSDMSAIHRAAMCCEVWDGITTGQWTPSGPLGGQYGGIWTFTVELPGDCLSEDCVSGNESS